MLLQLGDGTAVRVAKVGSLRIGSGDLPPAIEGEEIEEEADDVTAGRWVDGGDVV